jgi:small-conductance mechanosensitive channel
MNFVDQLPMEYRLILGAAILVAIAIAYKLLSRFISRTGERLQLEPHATNALRLVLRVVAIVVASSAVFTVFEIPPTVFVGGSALIGAFLGFGSSQTINNIVAGFYVLITQPFKVKDYVKIGDLEGQVEEITINYTNLYTPTFNLLKVPNTQVMNSRVLNMTHEDFIKYTFTINFSHDVPNTVLMEQCIQPAIDEFHDKHEEDQLRKPEVYMDYTDRWGRSFLIRFFIPKGEAKKLYVLKPELLSMIMERWDKLENQ